MVAADAAERLRIALDLADAGRQMMLARLRREHPDWSDDEVDRALNRWWHDRPGAPFGDHPGRPSPRPVEDLHP